MDQPLPWLENNHNIFQYIDIKFDWESFHWVIDIHSLWNELLWLEYCIKEAFSVIKKQQKLNDINISDLVILVEPFQNNCFRKKIKVWIKWMEKHPVTVWTTITLTLALIWWSYQLIKDLNDNDINKISSNNISQEQIAKISDQALLNLFSNKKYREELSKLVLAVKHENDVVEIRTNNISGEELLTTLDTLDKDKAIKLASDTSEENIEIKIEEWKYYGRINRIDLDATKRQIWFKINWEWREIDCILSIWLNIFDYKDLLWERVFLEWVSEIWTEIEKIEIRKIEHTSAPLKLAKNMQIDIK